MVTFLNNQVFMFVDDTFKKLLHIIPQELSFEETKKYLHEYTYEESKGSKPGETAAFYHRPGLYPTNTCDVFYTPFDKPFQVIIHIGYPSIKKSLDKSHSKTISESLEKFFDREFVRRETDDGLLYWQKGFCIVYKRIKTIPTLPDVFAIEVLSFDTHYFVLPELIETLKQYEKEKLSL